MTATVSPHQVDLFWSKLMESGSPHFTIPLTKSQFKSMTSGERLTHVRFDSQRLTTGFKVVFSIDF